MRFPPAEIGKYISARHAANYIENGMKLGLGTGSTAAWLVKYLGKAKREGLQFRACATSSVTTKLAQSLGIEIESLDRIGRLDLAIDGADEFDTDFNLIKGGGGALLQEKIVEAAAERLVVITDASKDVGTLGAFPLPVEIVKFGWETTQSAVKDVLKTEGYEGKLTSRRGGDDPFVTDEQHFILDLSLEKITDVHRLNARLLAVPGVVETGLFVDMADTVVMGDAAGFARVRSKGSDWENTPYDVAKIEAEMAELAG